MAMSERRLNDTWSALGACRPSSYCANAGLMDHLAGGLDAPPGSLWLWIPNLRWVGVRLEKDPTSNWASESMFINGECESVIYSLSFVMSYSKTPFEILLQDRSSSVPQVSFEVGDEVIFDRQSLRLSKQQLSGIPWPTAHYEECDLTWSYGFEPFGLFEERRYRVMSFPWPGFVKLFGVDFPIWHDYLKLRYRPKSK